MIEIPTVIAMAATSAATMTALRCRLRPRFWQARRARVSGNPVVAVLDPVQRAIANPRAGRRHGGRGESEAEQNEKRAAEAQPRGSRG